MHSPCQFLLQRIKSLRILNFLGNIQMTKIQSVDMSAHEIGFRLQFTQTIVYNLTAALLANSV